MTARPARSSAAVALPAIGESAIAHRDNWRAAAGNGQNVDAGSSHRQDRRASADISENGAAVRVERTPAADDTDSATRQTIQKICAYIDSGIRDTLGVGRCADYAWRHFGMGSESPAMKCWAVFWWVKHCIKFQQDEVTMFRVGLADEQDLLIDPALLVRMKDPAEDCDGFTMLGTAMLAILGVPVYIVTVAASPDDRTRWSHIFPIAVLTSGVLPLDMSHGVGPGWMVPRGQIYRWQAWDLKGRPVDIGPRKFQGLHGYVRRGMGSCDPATGIDDTTGEPCSASSASDWYGNVSPGSPVPGMPYVFQAPPTPPAGMDWTQFAQALALSAGKVMGQIVTPPAYQQVVRDQYGNIVSTTVRNATGATAFTAGAGALSSSPVIWIGAALLGVVILSSMGKSR